MKNLQSKYGTIKFQVNQYQCETKTLDGKEYYVVPVVMMIEGVRSGSHGPILHTAENLAKNPEAWQGTPVTIGHPQIDDTYVSVNDAGDIAVGHIDKPFMDKEKLRASAWLDKDKLDADTTEIIKQGLPLDVSIGVFTEENSETGEYNGQSYEAIAYNYQPDHLALLPGDIGACSYDDGCGIRVNKQGGQMDTLKVIRELSSNGFTIHLGRYAESIHDKLSKLHTLINGLDNTSTHHYMVEAYDNTVIYEQGVKTAEDNPREYKLYKRGYAMNAEEQPEWVGEPVEVRRQVEYLPISTNKKEGGTQMERTTGKPCVLVDKLIANTLTQFTEDDREWLQAMEPDQLNRLQPVEPKAVEPQINKEQAATVLRESLKTADDFMALMPQEVKAQMEHGQRLHNNHRKDLIGSIQTNAKDVFTAEELEQMETPMLEKIVKGIKPITDYSLNGNGSDGFEEASEEQLLPPGVQVETN